MKFKKKKAAAELNDEFAKKMLPNERKCNYWYVKRKKLKNKWNQEAMGKIL